MESEQFMKLTEDIRKQLSRGNYQMDMGDLPYSAQARNVAAVLWEQGWRPTQAESSLFQECKIKYETAYAILFSLHWRLTSMLSAFPANSREREAFQDAIEVVNIRMGYVKNTVQYWEDKETEALKAEGHGE